MSSVGTFGTFTAAQLGIYASQKGLSITGNNIANINTQGYTRQVLQQVSLKTGAADRYANKYDVHVGQGVLCTGVSQIRDPYLDIRYRAESSKVGYADTVMGTYNDLADFLDEVGDGPDGYGVLSTGFDEFVKALAGLDVETGLKVNDTLVRKAAEKLAGYFHTYADDLARLKKNKEDGMRQDITRVNELLTGIRDLNAAIRKSEIHGDNALEMRDDRNLMIDELSRYLKIDVVYSMEDIGAGLEVEKLTIKLGDANPDATSETDEVRLVDGIYAAQLTTPKANPAYDATYTPKDGDPPEALIKQFKYLDENGDGTNDPLDAKPEFDENYNIGLSKLLDSKGREWKETKIEPKTIKPSDLVPPAADVDNLKAALKAATPEKPVVIKDADGLQILVTGVKGDLTGVGADGLTGKLITTTYSKEIDQFDDNDLYGAIQADREMLTEEGEFATKNTIEGVDENAAIKRGIPYYQKSLDLLARQFAKTYNEANKGYLVDENGNYLKNTGTDEEPVYEKLEISYYKDPAGTYYIVDDINPLPLGMTEQSLTVNKDLSTEQQEILRQLQHLNTTPGDPDSDLDIDEFLKDQGIEKIGGNLFSIRGDTDADVDPVTGEGITAANIDIAHSWSTGSTQIVSTFIKPFNGELANSTEGTNVIHMIALLNKAQVYNPQDWYPAPDPDDPNSMDNIAQSEYIFNGSFTEFVNNMSSVLGSDSSKMNSQLDTSYNAAVELDSSRMGTSSVDLNDEAMNLMQYSKSLNAAYRLMTTIDEALDRLINNTGIVGR